MNTGESTVGDVAIGEAPALSSPAGRYERVAAAATAHPVMSTAIIGAVFLVAQMAWIVRARHLGSFDVDEAGGLAAAMRFHRSFGVSPIAMVRDVFGTYNGPLVPLLALPFLVVGPASVHTVMVVQPLLVVLASVSAAGMLRAMGHRRAALLGGIAVMGLSISVVSSRSFQYSTGVGAFLAVSLWALMASRQGRSRWHMVGMGAAVGAMLLCRTMSASFLPAIAVAALIVVAWRERAVLINIALGVLTAVAVAGPWWFIQWDQIMRYLMANAYGDRAHYWGSVPAGARLRDHWIYWNADFRIQIVLVALVLILCLAAVVARRSSTSLRLDVRPVLAAWAVVILGSVALLSTSNRGFWFAYPLDIVFVVGVVALLARVGDEPVWIRRARDGLAVTWVGLVVVTYVISLNPTGPADPRTEGWSDAERFIASLDRLQIGNIDADERLGSSDLGERRLASQEWQAANVELAQELQDISESSGPLLQSVTGEIHLFNANTILLAQEVSGKGINALEVVNTLEPTDDELRESTAPEHLGRPRVLVIVDGRSLPFPDGRDIERLRGIAEAEGWVERRRIPLPDGGDVTVYTHPDSPAAG